MAKQTLAPRHGFVKFRFAGHGATGAAAIAVVGLALLSAIAVEPAQAQAIGNGVEDTRPKILQQVGLEQRLDQQLPLETPFKDDTGKDVVLGDYFGKRPVILALVYYRCPMMCNLVMNGLTSALTVIRFNVGREFDVVTVSIDPRETPAMAAAKKQLYLKRYHRNGSEQGWHMLTGKQDSIDAVAKATGFRYAWDPATQQFAHPSAIMIVTPEGRLSQYYYGIEYGPNDLRLGLVEASKNKIGNLVDQVLLYCYHYDPATGKYGAVAMRIMRIGGAATVIILGAFIVAMTRRDRNQVLPPPSATSGEAT